LADTLVKSKANRLFKAKSRNRPRKALSQQEKRTKSAAEGPLPDDTASAMTQKLRRRQ
jgi:hypothetical protein